MSSYSIGLTWALRETELEDGTKVYDLLGVQEQLRGRVVLNCADERHARMLFAILNSSLFLVGGRVDLQSQESVDPTWLG